MVEPHRLIGKRESSSGASSPHPHPHIANLPADVLERGVGAAFEEPDGLGGIEVVDVEGILAAGLAALDLAAAHQAVM